MIRREPGLGRGWTNYDNEALSHRRGSRLLLLHRGQQHKQQRQQQQRCPCHIGQCHASVWQRPAGWLLQSELHYYVLSISKKKNKQKRIAGRTKQDDLLCGGKKLLPAFRRCGLYSFSFSAHLRLILWHSTWISRIFS